MLVENNSLVFDDHWGSCMFVLGEGGGDGFSGCWDWGGGVMCLHEEKHASIKTDRETDSRTDGQTDGPLVKC